MRYKGIQGERDKTGEVKDFEILANFNSMYLITEQAKVTYLSPCFRLLSVGNQKPWCQVKIPERIVSNVIHPSYLLVVSFQDIMKLEFSFKNF